MAAATSKASHVTSIMRLLGGWTERVSYGIPVGGAASRLIAEITISSTDEALVAAGYRFLRYNDDYRIFVRSHSEGYRALAFLAQHLHDTCGLTLQTGKTTVVGHDTFCARYLPTPEDVELQRLREQWHELTEAIGLDTSYEDIDQADLSEEQREIVDSHNLPEMFRAEMQREGEPDVPIMQFVLRRLAQRGTEELVDDVLDNMDRVYQVLPVVIEYLRSLKNTSPKRRHGIASQILDLVNGSLVSELEYHQMWLLDLFAGSTEWDHSDRFFALLGQMSSLLARRKLVLAMGRAHSAQWFASRRTHWTEESPWVKRAFLAGASCMPADQRKHWYKSIEPRLDILELAVVRWAKQDPF